MFQKTSKNINLDLWFKWASIQTTKTKFNGPTSTKSTKDWRSSTSRSPSRSRCRPRCIFSVRSRTFLMSATNQVLFAMMLLKGPWISLIFTSIGTSSSSFLVLNSVRSCSSCLRRLDSTKCCSVIQSEIDTSSDSSSSSWIPSSLLCQFSRRLWREGVSVSKFQVP